MGLSWIHWVILGIFLVFAWLIGRWLFRLGSRPNDRKNRDSK
jgi:hypothetical protein